MTSQREPRCFYEFVKDEPRQLSKDDLKKKLIVYYAGFYGTTGIARASVNNVTALCLLPNVVVYFEPTRIQHPPTKEVAKEGDNIFSAVFECARPLVSNDSQKVKFDVAVLHGDPTLFPKQCETLRKENPGIKIGGLYIWETDLIPRFGRTKMGFLDFAPCACRWNQETLKKTHPDLKSFFWPHVVNPIRKGGNGKVDVAVEKDEFSKKIFVFKNGVVEEVVTRDALALARQEEQKTVKILNVGQWCIRKNIHGSLQVFVETFSSPSSAAVPFYYLKTFCGYGEGDKAIAEWFKTHCAKSKFFGIVCIDLWQRSESFMNMLYNDYCDIFFAVPRAEGLGLGAAEAYALGKRVVITGYGGQRDYVFTPYWIDYELESTNICDNPLENHEKCPYSRIGCVHQRFVDQGGQMWSRPLRSSAILMLRKAFEDEVAGKEIEKGNEKDFDFSFERVASDFNKICQEIGVAK